MEHPASATTGVGGPAAGARRIELQVDDLHCPTCGQTVEQALRAVAGVSAATVNRCSSVAFVDYDPARTSVAALYEALKTAGYRTGSAATHVKIKGMTCASCVTGIEQALRSTPGVLSAHANLGTEEAVVQYVPGTTDLKAVRNGGGLGRLRGRRDAAPGGPSAVDRESEEREREYRTLMRQWWFGAAVGIFTMIMSYPWLFPGLRRLVPAGEPSALVHVGRHGRRLAGGHALQRPPLLHGRLAGAQAPLGEHAHADRAGDRRGLDLLDDRPAVPAASSRRASSPTSTTT